MSDLAAWVPIWEREPALVPVPWFKSGKDFWMRYAPGSSRVPAEAKTDDIDAQIGRAVVWLAERSGVFSTNINDLWQVVYRGRTIVTDQPSPQDALVAACQFVLDAHNESPA